MRAQKSATPVSLIGKPHSLCQHDGLAGRPRVASEARALPGAGGGDVRGTRLGTWSARRAPSGSSRRNTGGKAAARTQGLYPQLHSGKLGCWGWGGTGFPLPRLQFLNIQKKE